MRIDKFLKIARLIKRRAISKKACNEGLVSINDKICKPSSLVKIGDIIKISFATKKITIKILSLNENETLFKLIKEEKGI